jgi:hypothetical protein
MTVLLVVVMITVAKAGRRHTLKGGVVRQGGFVLPGSGKLWILLRRPAGLDSTVNVACD